MSDHQPPRKDRRTAPHEPVSRNGSKSKKPPHFRFRLYVAGDAPNSAQAIFNLRALCRQHLPEQHESEIVNVMSEPQRALADGVLLTPLLMKLSPAPVRRLIGNLSQLEPTLSALGLTR